MKKYLQILITSLITVSFIFIQSCEESKNESDFSEQAGALLKAEYLLTMSAETIQSYMEQYEIPITLDKAYSTEAYRLVYITTDKHGELTEASGVLIIPQGLDTLALISAQHGTTILREAVGSRYPSLYAFEAMLSAARGYLVAAPDYLGLGNSQLLHPYLHAGLSATAVVDMLRATRIYCEVNNITLSDKLFLAGYSEGGFVTMATQRFIEAELNEEFQLTAVAPMAGPYDLVNTTNTMLAMEEYNHPSYLAYVMTAYNDVYDWNRLDEIFQQPYADQMPSLFDGSLSSAEIDGLLPKQVTELFDSSFVARYHAGLETELTAALKENSLLNWGPNAPVRLYHGDADNTVFYANALAARDSLRSHGGLSVELVTISGGTHATSILPSLELVGAWFDSLRQAE